MRPAALATLFVFLFVTQIAAQEADRADTTFNMGKNWLLELDPDDPPYPDYLADPRRPRMEVGVGVADSDIPSTSSTRVMLDLGTRYTLLKITPNKAGKNEFNCRYFFDFYYLNLAWKSTRSMKCLLILWYINEQEAERNTYQVKAG